MSKFSDFVSFLSRQNQFSIFNNFFIILIIIGSLIPAGCMAIPSCNPTKETVQSGNLNMIDLIQTHEYVFTNNPSTVAWHLKIKNPDKAKFYDEYPSMLLSVWECDAKGNNCRNIISSGKVSMEPSVFINNPKNNVYYVVQVICAVGLNVEYELYNQVYHCESKSGELQTPSWLTALISFVQDSPFTAQKNERIYRSSSKRMEYIGKIASYFDGGSYPPSGTDCLDRAVYLFYTAQNADIPASVVIWGPLKKDGSGHANVIINNKLYDSTSSRTDSDYFYENYHLVGVADTYDEISFYLDPSVW